MLGTTAISVYYLQIIDSSKQVELYSRQISTMCTKLQLLMVLCIAGVTAGTMSANTGEFIHQKCINTESRFNLHDCKKKSDCAW